MGNHTSVDEYKKFLKAGQKEYKDDLSAGEEANPQVLDSLLKDVETVGQVSIGLIDIPTELIVGTKTAGRQFAFSRSFYPLLGAETEFAARWCWLHDTLMSDKGVLEPIRCFEYYGKFYVQEGNKRVSVMRHSGSSTIPGYVTRILPVDDGSAKYRLYQDFLEFYKTAPFYSLQFTQSGSYQKLLAQLGMAGQEWSPAYLTRFRSGYYRLRQCMQTQLYRQDVTPADMLMIFLRYHKFDDLLLLDNAGLLDAVYALQRDAQALAEKDPVAVSTKPAAPVKENILGRILPRRAKHLHIAFIHERDAEQSNWTRGHEIGRAHLEAMFPNQVTTSVYLNAVPGPHVEELIEQAAQDGANVIFTTTPPMMDATMRAAARYPEIRMLNCSVYMPYPDVRTYYGRVYEGKFITGAIAGIMARDGRIGYVGSYPIYGVPASINAFALGAKMVNPDAEIHLEWSCVRSDSTEVFRRKGISVVSYRDIPVPGQQYVDYGTCILQPDGTATPLASPVWYWGRLYENIVRSLLDGSWDVEQTEAGKRAVNYWWGMNSGVIDVLLDDALPDGVMRLAQMLRRELQSGQLDPFARKVIAQDGSVKNDGGKIFAASEILHMDWLCDCVKGSIPSFEEILPMARRTVRLQGVYRDMIPPEIGV